MRLFVGDYLKDTMHLSTLQHGAYMLLIMHYYTNGAALPDDNDYLAAVAKLSPSDWSRNRKTIAKFFSVGAGKWTHKRVEQELKDAREKRNSYSIRATKGNAIRWGSRQANAEASPSDTSSNPNPVAGVIAFNHQSSLEHTDTRESLPVELPEGFPQTANDAKAHAGFIGCSEDFAAQVWTKAMSRGGSDAKGQPIRSFRHYLSIEFIYEKQRTANQPIGKRGIDRSKGTANEGRASDYSEVG